MAVDRQQLDIFDSPPQGQVIPTALHAEMQRSYLEYAMSVIVGRALPDARDGLKPVHRRILFAMHELGLLPDRPFRKCARVVGDVLGKYHPHGDQSVYDALVRLVQDFSCRYPLLAGHGNFGSVDDDPPAAMRYTECRLAGVGHYALLSELNQAVVDFVPNFDGSQPEPVMLPARLPILLLNGAVGIAVGMATNIPPHNLTELVTATIALIDRPDLSIPELLSIVPAPDFPTGGIIVDDGGLAETYGTGRGAVIVRGVATIEPDYKVKGKRARQAIVISELPFQVNKSAWIEKVAELVEQGKLVDVLDVRDESDRSGMRVVIELRKEANSDLILEKLYRQTALQINFGVILLALKTTGAGSQPKQMSLRELLQEFIDFRLQTLTRKYRYELEQATHKLHLVQGFQVSIEQIELVINLIRGAKDTAEAKKLLAQRIGVTAIQAQAILELPLRRLTAMERQSLDQEQSSLTKEIHRLEKLLGDRQELLKAMKKDLRELQKTYGDPRRTQIIKQIDLQKSITEEPTPPTPCEILIQITHKGYIRAVDAESRFTKNYSQTDDALIATYTTTTDRELLIFSANGKALSLPCTQIPLSKTNKQKGIPLVTLLPEGEQPVSFCPWHRQSYASASSESIVLLSSDAKIKRSPVTEFLQIGTRGLLATKLKDQEQLFWADLVPIDRQLVIVTTAGRLLRMQADEEQIPILGRTAMGNIAMRLGSAETLAGVGVVDLNSDPDTELILITAMGYGRRVRARSLRLSPRGSIGSQIYKFQVKHDLLRSIVVIANGCLAVSLTIANEKDNSLRSVHIAISDIPQDVQGRYLLAGPQELNGGEQVVRAKSIE